MVVPRVCKATTTKTPTETPPRPSQISPRIYLPTFGGGEALTAGIVPDDESGEIGSRSPRVETLNSEHQNQPQQCMCAEGEKERRNTPLPHLSEQTNKDRPIRKRKAHRKNVRTRANLTLGSLNVNGGGSKSTQHKWENINQIVRDEKIHVLTIQETHLTAERTNDLQTRYPRLHIINSIDPDQTNAKGVAIILDKNQTRWKETHSRELIKGRALIASIPWKQEKTLNILAIYAPNNHDEQIKFWTDLREMFNGQTDIPRPDIMIGDFNVVENKIDRDPPNKDPQAVIDSLQLFREHHELQDTWRNENPDTLSFTYLQFQNTTRKSQSRIDRIYMRNESSSTHHSWKSRHSGIPSDHKLITVKIENPEMPYIGKGRWAMPHYIFRNKELMNKIKIEGRAHLLSFTKAIDENCLDKIGPQEIHQKFKASIQERMRECTRTAVPKIDNLIIKKKTELKEALSKAKSQNKVEDTSQGQGERMATALAIEEELLQLHLSKHQNKRDEIQAKFWREAETIGKPWINVNKITTPRETIYRLKKPNQTLNDTNDPDPKYITRSDEMANAASLYHDSLQKIDTQEQRDDNTPNRETKIKRHLKIVKRRLTDDENKFMGEPLNEINILNAIRALPNGKSPGLDGITTELYKKLAEDFLDDKNPKEEENEEEENHSFDITKYLKIIYQDYAVNGPTEGSNFAEGWMCPLYKKNDKADIANYRPITVLNTDYKIMTRALTTKMGAIAKNIIHPDQAGFIKERHIADHTDLVQMLTSMCETLDEQGAIICLDQEKAYDKIKHDYLWQVLDEFNFPPQFKETVQNLYGNAYTTVIINGVQSKPYKVIRGVRQGDPLSCLLFNLAIEPLAEMIRESNLAGIQIDDEGEVKVSLFADDTTVYLSKSNDINDLFEILDNWCEMSGAKFNKTKTEIIPLGQIDYRDSLRETRALQIGQKKLDSSIKIAREGQPVRVLGAWIGYNVDQEAIWDAKIDKINSILKRWDRGHPTQEGRRLIIGMYVPGMTQYATRAQGMEDKPEKRCTRLVNTFMWAKEEGERISPPIRTTVLREPINHGGKKVIDIGVRNEAIDLMRLKTLLTRQNPRPAWARIADKLFSEAASKGTKLEDPKTRSSIFLQTWKANLRNTTSPLPPQLISLLKVAKKYNLQMNPPILSLKMKEEMPIWHHPGVDNTRRAPNQKGKVAECLRRTHNIFTVRDAVRVADTEWSEDHESLTRCECAKCTELRNLGCKHPNYCVTLADKWVNALTPKNEIAILLTKKSRDQEDCDMIKQPNNNLLRAVLAGLRSKSGDTLMSPGKCQNARKLLKDSSVNETKVNVHNLEATKNFKITGARVESMTQAMMYKGIMKYETKRKQLKHDKTSRNEDQITKDNREVDEEGNTTRTATMRRLDITRHAIMADKGKLPADEDIWESLRNKDISKKIRAFMWTAMHDGQKIGEYWSNKTNYEHRGQCRLCDTTETMEHLLTECRGSGQNTAWNLAEQFLRNKIKDWKRPSLGLMLGQGYIPLHRKNKSPSNKSKATNRLITIVITETMHLIWKLRCEWKIGRNEDEEKQITTKEVNNKWHSVINTRLKIDCLLTNRRKYGNKALKRGMVMDTWIGTLADEPNLVEDWARPGVLVGIKPAMA